MKLSKHFPKYRLPLPLTLLAAILLAGCVTLLTLWCQPNALRSVAAIFLKKPILIVLNAMPIGLLILLFTCLLRNVFFSASLVNLVMCGLSIANRIKIEVRDEPVFPRDLALLKEVGSAMGAYDIRFPWTVMAVALFATLLLAALGLFVGCKPFPAAKLRGWRGSFLGAVLSLAALVLVTVTVLGSSSLYQEIGCSNPYRLSTVFNETGFPYSFFHQFTTYQVDRPDGFSKAQAEEWEYAAVDTKPEHTPVNVVMVMNEAFSDISDYSAFFFEKEPLPNLQAMRQDPHAITGHIVVPGFAGGTANTEFDVLTGIQTNALSATTTSAMRVVNRNLDSLFRVFGADDYHTSYFHPGDDWFYNRENVLRWMGAEETVFTDQMADVEYKGRWVTDSYVADLIEAEFEETMAQGESLFHYSTTIQNHMSYTVDKYGADYEFPPLETSMELSEQVRTMLEVYIEGARDADAMLGQLRDYFAAREEPVVLVFFGDHLPYLGDNQLGYAELGLTQESSWADLTSYETPYVIWSNNAAAEALDWESTISSLALPETLSASFLGAALLELTGHSEASPWFSFLNELRWEAPIIHKQVALLSNGTLQTDPASWDAILTETVQKWRQWSYYKLKYQEFDG